MGDPMTVYLVPVGERRYQLYLEAPLDDATAVPDGDHEGGWIARQIQRFRQTLAEAEQARLRRERGEPDGTSGLWAALLRRVAESIAEQRLLWHLRHETHVTLCYPDDVPESAALADVRAEFTRDVAKHRRWLIIDGLAVLVTGPTLMLLPGPNLLSWFFSFRVIGHWLSWRGARRGLTEIVWHGERSAPLAAVRAALDLPAHDRRLRLLAIGDELGLAHLAGFVERVRARDHR